MQKQDHGTGSRTRHETPGGFAITTNEEVLADATPIEELIDALDRERGAVFASSYEVPGRYSRWDIGFRNPPLAVVARGQELTITALNARGRVLVAGIARALTQSPVGEWIEPPRDPSQRDEQALLLRIPLRSGSFAEEERSRQPSVFAVLRELVAAFAPPPELALPDLGLYGAFGYDLAFQFEPIRLRHRRDASQRDLVLYLPDELVVVDHRLEQAKRVRYEFEFDGQSTVGSPREGPSMPYRSGDLARGGDHEPGEYAQVVRRARGAFARGDLFEVVPSQVFSEACPAPPSEVFRRLRARNPSPYGFVMNLGADETLVGASPEMFVRVSHSETQKKSRRQSQKPVHDPPRRVETCPIAGTIARGADALGDARQIQSLLNSQKDECELTMCTDVDRNDKSRVCEPESIRVLSRRQIELYSRLIHTVDHVEGTLLPGRDALDAFLAHAWAVTVTGAPKRAAMEFIEEHELSPRRFYGGAVGRLGFDGSLNTGLVLRTVRIAAGNAEVRVGATLLHDSDPLAEERETELKASALLDAIRRPDDECAPPKVSRRSHSTGDGKRVLIVDAQDSFVHTLGGYFRRTGARVKTLRAGFPMEDLAHYEPDLIVLSPGPGRPSDFGLASVLAAAVSAGLPVFGVCLGLQAIAEFFGGELGVLAEPMHGKASQVHVHGGELFRGFPAAFEAGRYHSLHARRETLPPELVVTASDEHEVVMALAHQELPISAVQFHPESILTQTGGLGMRLVENLLGTLPVRARARASRVFSSM